MNIFETAIKCMDTTYKNSPADFLENSDIVDEVDKLIMEFRAKFEIPNDTEIGNADAVETNWDEYNKAKTEMEIKIFELCWSVMQDAMTNWGLGDIAREVFASEICNTPLSWDVRAKALAESASAKKDAKA